MLPGLWCVVAAVHLRVLGLDWWSLLLLAAVCAFAAPVLNALMVRRAQSS